jgi:hypothetical protein
MAEQSPYSYYLELLGQWPTSIALASQWFVYFDFSSIDTLVSNFETVLKDRETRSHWSYKTDVAKYLLDGKLQYSVGNLMGCAFARSVRLPSEVINATHEGLVYGGFQAPATSSGREKYEKVELTMLETNASFIDFILRPWTVAVGYNGLVARPKNSEKYVKANFMDVVMLAKTGAYSPMGIRKIYTFYNVAPVRIPAEEYSYLEEGLRTSNVEFIYDNYSVSDGNSGNLIGLP